MQFTLDELTSDQGMHTQSSQTKSSHVKYAIDKVFNDKITYFKSIEPLLRQVCADQLWEFIKQHKGDSVKYVTLTFDQGLHKVT